MQWIYLICPVSSVRDRLDMFTLFIFGFTALLLYCFTALVI